MGSSRDRCRQVSGLVGLVAALSWLLPLEDFAAAGVVWASQGRSVLVEAGLRGSGMVCAALGCSRLFWAVLRCSGKDWAGLGWSGLVWAGGRLL